MGLSCAVWIALAGSPTTALPAGDGFDHGSRVRLALDGATRASAGICGVERRATTAPQDDDVAAVVQLRRGARGVAASVRLRIDRCVDASWVHQDRVELESPDSPKRLRTALDTAGAGEFRIRAVARTANGDRLRSKRRFLKVTSDVAEVPVRFTVSNTNRSGVACPADGAEYVIAGHLVGPRDVLSGPSQARATTLYLHEFSFGEFFWDFDAVPGYDHAAEMAKAGHVSVVVDRLGYDSSPGPEGNAVCLGSNADIAHQIVEQLRTGSYASGLGGAPRFDRIALAGHSVGGAIAEIEAYSFADVDALVLLGWADQGLSEAVLAEGVQQGGRCVAGGEPAEPGGPGGYAYFSATPETFQKFSFHDADPEVVAAATAMRNRDPCGDVNSQVQAIATNNARIGELDVPVLLLYGRDDPVFSDPMAAGEQQAAAYTASPDVTTEYIDGSAHAMTLERSAGAMRTALSSWLADRGFR